uniref:Cytochrome c oxidase subunit 3 n=1 Tax=Eucinetus haemorrhoidalis TaxID=1490181 RepID=A0A343A4B0_9COLE|nr:cytochrome c oxidase subunit III [Eucinetus haemorrhoidalis]AOY39388.1 cytochrome c oxidase subunit 3 [Eucinetus haemorrhoidalis]
MKNHPFHLVEYSPWPLIGAFSVMIMVTGMLKWFHLYKSNLLLLGTLITLLVMYQWWRDVVREGTFQGLHTFKVSMGLKLGMILFIVSEIFFFISFFWSFFYSMLNPTIEIGLNWPPQSISPFNPLHIPLLNTVILISSGFTVTWAHHSLIENNYSQAIQSLSLTVMLGVYFTLLQGLEYYEAPFTISDSSYGSTFFMMTGFHGIHVMIGTIFLSVCLMRLYNNHFSSIHHFGFEAAAWYWHFVDVVWLFLYILVYWLGS